VLILAYVSLASPPRRPPSPPLFPYTTLFRSDAAGVLRHDRLMGKRRETVMRETIDVESIGLHGDLSAGSPFRVEEICSQHQIDRSEEHTSELQSRFDLVCRLLLEINKHRILI